MPRLVGVASALFLDTPVISSASRQKIARPWPSARFRRQSAWRNRQETPAMGSPPVQPTVHLFSDRRLPRSRPHSGALRPQPTFQQVPRAHTSQSQSSRAATQRLPAHPEAHPDVRTRPHPTPAAGHREHTASTKRHYRTTPAPDPTEDRSSPGRLHDTGCAPCRCRPSS